MARPRVYKRNEGASNQPKGRGIVAPLVSKEDKAMQILKQIQAAKDAPTVVKPRAEGQKSEAKIQEEAEAKPVVKTVSKKRSAPVPGIKLPKKKKQAPVSRTSSWVGKKVGKRAGAIEKGEDGTLRRVTKAEARASITTELPAQTAPAKPTPKSRMQTTVVTGRTQLRPSNRGFAQKPAQIAGLLSQAMVHLDNMKKTYGTPEFHQHHDAFNAVHATLKASGDDRAHTLLGIAAHTVRNPNHPDSAKHFDLSMKALRATIAQGSRVAGENAANAKAGQARARAARIAAEKAKKEGNA